MRTLTYLAAILLLCFTTGCRDLTGYRSQIAFKVLLERLNKIEAEEGLVVLDASNPDHQLLIEEITSNQKEANLPLGNQLCKAWIEYALSTDDGIELRVSDRWRFREYELLVYDRKVTIERYKPVYILESIPEEGVVTKVFIKVNKSTGLLSEFSSMHIKHVQ